MHWTGTGTDSGGFSKVASTEMAEDMRSNKRFDIGWVMAEGTPPRVRGVRVMSSALIIYILPDFKVDGHWF